MSSPTTASIGCLPYLELSNFGASVIEKVLLTCLDKSLEILAMLAALNNQVSG